MGQDLVPCPWLGLFSRRVGDDFLQLHHLVAGKLQQWGRASGVQEEHSRWQHLDVLLPLGRILAIGPAGLSALLQPREIRTGGLLACTPAVGRFDSGVQLRDMAMPVYRALSIQTGGAWWDP